LLWLEFRKTGEEEFDLGKPLGRPDNKWNQIKLESYGNTFFFLLGRNPKPLVFVIHTFLSAKIQQLTDNSRG
jgi:hypothetical protein